MFNNVPKFVLHLKISQSILRNYKLKIQKFFKIATPTTVRLESFAALYKIIFHVHHLALICYVQEIQTLLMFVTKGLQSLYVKIFFLIINILKLPCLMLTALLSSLLLKNQFSLVFKLYCYKRNKTKDWAFFHESKQFKWVSNILV